MGWPSDVRLMGVALGGTWVHIEGGQTYLQSDPRDADFSGVIDIKDARDCTLRCTRPSCAI